MFFGKNSLYFSCATYIGFIFIYAQNYCAQRVCEVGGIKKMSNRSRNDHLGAPNNAVEVATCQQKVVPPQTDLKEEYFYTGAFWVWLASLRRPGRGAVAEPGFV